MSASEIYYRDKVAIVTGGASGIGLALAEVMLSLGAAVVTLLDRDGDALERQTGRLNELHAGRVISILADVTLETEVIEAVAVLRERYQRIDFLFNNAGSGFSGAFDELTDDDWSKAFALNFNGPLYGIRAVLPIMRQQGSGHIVNIMSGIAFTPMAFQTIYAASKAALNALTLALRYELWNDGVRLTSATPGTTATSIWGAGGPPAHAQSASQAASRILEGVARNDRLVLGDDADASGATHAFDPAAAGPLDDTCSPSREDDALERPRSNWRDLRCMLPVLLIIALLRRRRLSRPRVGRSAAP